MRKPLLPICTLLVALIATSARSEDGYHLWLRHAPIEDATLRTAYTQNFSRIVFATPTAQSADSATLSAARHELAEALESMLGITPNVELTFTSEDLAGGDEVIASNFATTPRFSPPIAISEFFTARSLCSGRCKRRRPSRKFPTPAFRKSSDACSIIGTT
ncbi:MAG: hypothetical protein NVV74_10705 [Magnetospirillum sp.]|nr:hypothetical protein [Magnetospirillum sp.]